MAREKHGDRVRRGLSEVVGATIILIALVAASIATASLMTSSLKVAGERLRDAAQAIAEETDPIIIMPYVVYENGSEKLMLYASPVEPGENITVYVIPITGSQSLVKIFKPNTTVLNATLSSSYSCTPIYIILQTQSGALHAYNALRDPRVDDPSRIGDPRLFSCNIIYGSQMVNPPADPLTGLRLWGLQSPFIENNKTITIKKLYKFNISGWITVYNNGTKTCSLNINYNNQKHKIQECSAREKLDSWTDLRANYDLELVVNSTKHTVYAYIEIRPQTKGSLVTASINTQLTLARRYYYTEIRPYLLNFGRLNNTYMPIIYAPLSRGTIHSNSTIILADRYQEIRLNSTSYARATTTGPIVILLSTNKVPNLHFKQHVTLTVEKIIEPSTNTEAIPLGVTNSITITTKPVITPEPKDYLAEALNSINQDDWNLARPVLTISLGRTARELVINENSTLRILTNGFFNASILIRGGYNLAPVTAYQLNVTKWSKSNYGFIIDGETVIAPVPVAAHLPYIIKAVYNNTEVYFIYGTDYPQRIRLSMLTYPPLEQRWILYTFDKKLIELGLLNANQGCLVNVTRDSRIASITFNPPVECSGQDLRVEPQHLYLIALISSSSNGQEPDGFVYRLLWNS